MRIAGRIMEINRLSSDENKAEGAALYRRKGTLVMRKLAEYIPVMIITNISLLLINSVDRIIAGNFIGSDAMNSISIFYPVLLLTTVFSGPLASGIATCISEAMGKNDLDEIAHIKSTGLRLMIITAIVIGIIQIPVVFGIISTYDISDDLAGMVRQYAIGCMICTPISIVSTVGTYQMQIAGKMKVIMVLTMIEGVLNLLFDLLFVAVFHMGVEGTGYGTACSNLVRCVLTVIYMAKYTDFYKSDGKPVTLSDYTSIISCGLPDASFILMTSFQNYFMLQIIIGAFDDDGGIIYGLCSFCLTIINTLIFGIQGGMRPLMGLYTGAEDKQGTKELMRHGTLYVLGYAGAVTAAILFFPEFFYLIHGVYVIPHGGIFSVQLFSFSFIIRGLNNIQRLYLTNRKDLTFATILTVLGNATLPLFALAIAYMDVQPPYIFLAYTFTELLIFILSTVRYFYFRVTDSKGDPDIIELYMTVRREEAEEASESIMRFAEEHGINKRISYKAALCVEEMTAYIQRAQLLSFGSPEEIEASIRNSELAFLLPPDLDVGEMVSYLQKMDVLGIFQQDKSIDSILDKIQDSDLISDLPPERNVRRFIEDVRESDLPRLLSVWDPVVDIIFRSKGKDKAVLITLDDGKCIALDKGKENKKIVTSNYDLLRKVAKDIEYQYILDMNYTKIVLG